MIYKIMINTTSDKTTEVDYFTPLLDDTKEEWSTQDTEELTNKIKELLDNYGYKEEQIRAIIEVGWATSVTLT